MAVGRTLDDAFLSIMNDWCDLVSAGAEGAVEMILKNSGEYLSVDQQKAVADFHDLYFSDGDVSASKEAMNREVDDLVDAIQAQLSSGTPVDVSATVGEDDDAKRTRLSLSGVQKQLETIIQLETGLKEKLVPVLTSMQFEDAIKQRLKRMSQGWQACLELPPEGPDEAKSMGEQIGKTLGSAIERAIFYPNVLKRDPPKDAVEEMSLFEAFI